MAAPADAPYTMRGLQQMLGLSRGVIGRLVAARYVTPVRDARNAFRFTFQDVVLLRTAHALRASAVPHHILLASLRRLRESLPAEVPLSGLRIAAVGDRLAVLEPEAAWDPHSGQLLLDLERVDRPGGSTLHFRHPDQPRTAAEWYSRGTQIEDGDPAGAEAAYRRAIALQPDLVAAYVDLGAMLCEAGRCTEAALLYSQAIAHVPSDPLVHFNAAIAQEDLGQREAALRSYEEALALDPTMADAHFNAARLCEQLGRPQQALRHYSAYRRLEREAGAGADIGPE